MVNHIFRDLIEKSMEVYMDDLLVKSEEEANHIKHLVEAFSILRKFQMMLNLIKWAFRISSWKFLGHLVSRRGIEANPEKS